MNTEEKAAKIKENVCISATTTATQNVRLQSVLMTKLRTAAKFLETTFLWSNELFFQLFVFSVIILSAERTVLWQTI
jgi:hypothetical protein